ncbi:7TM diverse intracellular signaling domain-containing protein [Niabella beijingensis]|uniref:sensor histidine kinase n=1 Tax=Niabella beijingensis TaxID=2872700 RepID=UPI001CC10548|nr:7TM diverse intracellular signaling domain-containing protein [Niabella beijingensis]MBZ4187574.1 GHKL domain-containing protein [Niabella beijingensis]
MAKSLNLFFFVFIFLTVTQLSANDKNKITPQVATGALPVEHFRILTDKSDSLDIQQIVQLPESEFKEESPGIKDAAIWVRFDLENSADFDSLFLELENPVLQEVTFYTYRKGAIENKLVLGARYDFDQRPLNIINYVYPFFLNQGETATIFVRIKSPTSMHLPFFVSNKVTVFQRNATSNLLFGIYIGIIVIMLLYNLLLSIVVEDDSYYYYIAFIFFVGITQVVLQGYGFKFLWPGNEWFRANTVNLCGIFSGIGTLLFSRKFLHSRRYTPRLDKGFTLLICAYSAILPIHFAVSPYIAINLINVVAFVTSIYCLYVGYRVLRKGFRPARFFLLAISAFLTMVIIYVLRTSGVIPYNILTSRTLEIGSALQIMLLSLALADKINIYRRDQEAARKEALRVSVENERLIKEQNIRLEEEVRHRTEELLHINEELKVAMKQIQSTQAKLIDTEKMASLGQLTAGIAHEINNPINFVTSNIRPLEADVTDLQAVIRMYEKLDPSGDIAFQIQKIEKHKKDIDLEYLYEEISTLLSGIKEGAHRTSEIVKGLRSFARVDEANWKKVDLNEGIESTLLLVKSTFPQNFKLVKELGELPKIECAPGKINQVFMNIITNAVQTIQERILKDQQPGVLIIKTWEEDAQVRVSITDNGQGMTEEVKNKIFDPFFTTKDVGEGTGLGLSIVQGIIEKHNGTIQVDTELGRGTTFVISLPIR